MSRISADSSFFFDVFNSYKLTNNLQTSRIKQDFLTNLSTSNDYKGREVYELLQNAEDQNSTHVLISLDSENKKLSISNGGVECTPFSKEGFCSIMMANMSPKRNSGESFIGCKGLGFRSLLNWADEISIYSSGVCCKFSNIIVQNKWEELKQWLPKDVVDEHQDFARKEGVDTPMSILSVPEVKAAQSQNPEYVTTIEVCFKNDSLESIQKQIDTLSGKVLLFLSNISCIKIKIDDKQYELSKEIKSENVVLVKDKEHPQGLEYVIYKENGSFEDRSVSKKYEVSIAYNKDGEEKGNVLYTFFPTQVKISLPCVVHATFDLNSSRNSLNETEANNWIQERIADCLMAFAQELAAEDEKMSWKYWNLLHLDDAAKQYLPLLDVKLDRGIKQCKIFPTVGTGYLSLDQTTHYSEEMVCYALNVFDNHLINDFTVHGIQCQLAEPDFVDKLNAFSQKFFDEMCDLEEQKNFRTGLIKAVSTVKFNCPQKLYLLLDNKGKLFKNLGRINVGDSFSYLPDEMNISYVDKELIGKLSSALGVNDSDKRGLTKELRKCNLDVGDFDVSGMKSQIINYTKNSMTKEGFVQLMYALYFKFHESPSVINQYVFQQGNLADMFKSPDFRVLAKSGKRYYPSEVVISEDNIYNDDQRLLYSVDEWICEFNKINQGNLNIDKESVRKFLCDAVGVSMTIPTEYIPIDESANEYLDKYSRTLGNSINGYCYYYSSYIEDKNPNFYDSRCRVIKDSFINQLVNAGKSLSEIIGMIMADAALMYELNKRTLYFQQRTVKSEEVEVGCSLYKLRNMSYFKQLSKFVISENIIIDGEEKLQEEISALTKALGDKEAKQILLLLGARESITELDIQELYEALKELPNKKLAKGVQKLYKSIRDAINSKPEKEYSSYAEDFKNNGSAYARKNGGRLELKPISEIYYWDNEQLPHNVLSNMYRLELPNRVGEVSVKKIFGVKLWNEIKIEVKDFVLNPQLSVNVVDRIMQRMHYILAYRLQNSKDIKESKVFVNSIKRLEINVCSSCVLAIDGKDVLLNDGDMVAVSSTKNDTVARGFYVCTGMTDVESAFKTPSFCENITEILCITLKVTSNEMVNCFRSVLKNTLDENKFISNKEISLDTWDLLNKVIGLSDEEKRFWEQVGHIKHAEVDLIKLSSLQKEKVEYLRKNFNGICLPDTFTDVSEMTCTEKYKLLLSLKIDDLSTILGNDGLYGYYREWMKNKILQYKNAFARLMYDKTIKEQRTPYDYYTVCTEYMNGNWAFGKIDEMKCFLYEQDKLEQKFTELLHSEFKIEKDRLDLSSQPINLRQEYKHLLEERGLTQANIAQEHLVFALFENYENEFQKILDEHYAGKKEISVSIDSKEEDNDLEFSFGVGKNKFLPTRDGGSTTSRRGEYYVSEREKHKAGLLAEQKVYGYMRQKTEMFENVMGCSRNLDPVHGNDALHYDIRYRIKGELEERFLEVKSMSADTILMSKNEYDFALQNATRYDFAIVQKNLITILKSPFVSDTSKPMLQVIPDTYSITMEISVEE